MQCFKEHVEWAVLEQTADGAELEVRQTESPNPTTEYQFPKASIC